MLFLELSQLVHVHLAIIVRHKLELLLASHLSIVFLLELLSIVRLAAFVNLSPSITWYCLPLAQVKVNCIMVLVVSSHFLSSCRGVQLPIESDVAQSFSLGEIHFAVRPLVLILCY